MERPSEPATRLSTASSTSDSGSDSGSDSDSSSEDSNDDNVPHKTRTSPVPVEPPAASPKAEEETKPRWNLASYLDPNGVKEPVPSPQIQSSPLQNMTSNILPLNSKNLSDRKKNYDDSDASDSTKDLDIVLAEAIASRPEPLLSSFSDSDCSTKKKSIKKRKRVPVSVTNNDTISDSDSDEEPERTTKVHKPVNRASPRTKLADSNSDSDNEKAITLHSDGKSRPAVPKTVTPEKSSKPKSNRGRPRKVDGEGKSRPRGRPPNSNKPRPSFSGSDEEVKVKRRGRPPRVKPQPPPSSSDEETKISKPLPRKKNPKQEASSSSSDSDSSNETSRKNNKTEFDHDATKFNLPSKSFNKYAPKDKKTAVDSDHEDWSDKKMKYYNHLFDSQDRNNTNTNTKMDYTKKKEKMNAALKRKGKPNPGLKSMELLPTTTDTEDDSDTNKTTKKTTQKSLQRKKYRSSSNSDSDDNIDRSSGSERNAHCRLSMNNLNKNENKGKVEVECKAVQDKKKCDTLKKLFIQKRDSEGGKGGGKGGAKGGKGGKGKGGVIIVDGDYERSSSSLEDETMPTISNTSLLSPISNIETKGSTQFLSNEPIKSLKTEQINDDSFRSNATNLQSVMVRIDLNRLNFVPKSTKRRSEEMRQLSELADTRQENDTKSKMKNYDVHSPINNSDGVRHAQCDNSSEIKRTIVNESDSDMNNKKCKNKDSTSNEQSKNKGHKRKRHNSTSSLSSLSTVCSTVSQQSRRRENKKDKSHKSKRRKEEKIKSPKVIEDNSVNVPPTNHDREGPKTPPSINVNKSQNSAQVIREYHSYFERNDDQLDEDG